MAKLSFQQTCISLPNGAQGVLAQAPHLTRAHVSIAIAAGYLDEPRALPGLAHLLEHVLTTAPLEASSNISLLTWLAQHQGSLNAHTDDYVTDVHFSIPAETLESAALTVASQLARPAFSPSVICAEVAAIDAEWQARQHSSAMQRLSAIATLSDPQHICAGCRHGNAQTLGSDMALLLEALTAFHRDHYHGGRVSIAIISPWDTETMARLIKRMATLFSPPTPSALSLAITPRWSHLPHAKIARTGNAVELLWPLPSAIARHQLIALSGLADSVQQGYLVEQLPDSITDYRATLAPSGATDAFSLTLSGTATQEQVKALAAALSERLATFFATLLGTAPNDHDNRWQPPADTLQLAPAWFTHARRQALARRFATPPSEHQPAAILFAASNARWLLDNASPSPSPPAFDAFDRQPAAYPAVQHWCGQYGVSDDFAALATTAWAACFVPEAIVVPSPLTAQRLALQAIVFKQENSPHGSWVIAMGSKANHAMVALLEDAVLAASKAQQGLLAQQLIQRLTPLPAAPAVWVSHNTGAAAVCHALANLASRVAIHAEQPPPASLATSTAIMRTLSLPGTPSQRLLLALAEQHHSAAFFQQARYDHHLGYVAAVRRGDGAPCSLGYVVQTSNAGQVSNVGEISKDAGSTGRKLREEKRIAEKLQSITDALWKTSDSVLQAQLPTLTPPETPLAALVLQWQSLLAGTHQPLHRLGQQRIDSRALTNLLSQVNTLGHWQTHWLDSAGHYFVSD
ncbi:insulinase family protein [Halomonas sp. MS1]|nr:insulinase family protein [Halomonas sp. MS1]UTD56560.1 insulinase family protein [Halomonas sp. MS1]